MLLLGDVCLIIENEKLALLTAGTSEHSSKRFNYDTIVS